MPIITLVVAYNENFVIGKGNDQLPWYVPDDLKLFRELTWGKSCIMGRKTWDMLPLRYRPLPGRTNIVISRDIKQVLESKFAPPHEAYTSVDEAIAAHSGEPEICIVGGGQIYDYCIRNGLASRVFASELKHFRDVEGDAFFPNLKGLGWIGKPFRSYDQFEVIEYSK